jgi:hypothetical protein
MTTDARIFYFASTTTITQFLEIPLKEVKVLKRQRIKETNDGLEEVMFTIL